MCRLLRKRAAPKLDLDWFNFKNPAKKKAAKKATPKKWYTWVMSAEELLAQVLRLPRTERARLAEEVLSSLEESDEQVAAAWARELERRSREIAQGAVQPVDWDTARGQVLKEIEQRRADRPSP